MWTEKLTQGATLVRRGPTDKQPRGDHYQDPKKRALNRLPIAYHFGKSIRSETRGYANCLVSSVGSMTTRHTRISLPIAYGRDNPRPGNHGENGIFAHAPPRGRCLVISASWRDGDN